MVVLTEAVRRWGREWDRYIVSQAMQRDVPRRRRGDNKSKIEGKDMATSTREQEEGKASRVPSQDEIHRLSKDQDSIIASPAPPRGAATIARMQSAFFGLPRGSPGAQALASHSGTLFRPTVVQQAVRSLVYGVQFTGAVSRSSVK
jgi:copper transporter 1